MIKLFLQNESGATAIEYGLIAALISLALVSGAKLMGDTINDRLSDVGTAVKAAGNDYLGGSS